MPHKVSHPTRLRHSGQTGDKPEPVRTAHRYETSDILSALCPTVRRVGLANSGKHLAQPGLPQNGVRCLCLFPGQLRSPRDLIFLDFLEVPAKAAYAALLAVLAARLALIFLSWLRFLAALLIIASPRRLTKVECEPWFHHLSLSSLTSRESFRTSLRRLFTLCFSIFSSRRSFCRLRWRSWRLRRAGIHHAPVGNLHCF